MTDGFKAYPKWITTPAGIRKIVEDAEEEAAEMAVAPPALPPASVPAETPPVENVLVKPTAPSRADLVAEAEAKGIRVDGRWSDARLAEELQKATA